MDREGCPVTEQDECPDIVMLQKCEAMVMWYILAGSLILPALLTILFS